MKDRANRSGAAHWLKWFVKGYSKAYSQWRRQYTLKVDSLYYSEKSQQEMVALQVRGKRGLAHIPVKELFSNPVLMEELHPMEASALGWVACEQHEQRVQKIKS